MTKLNMPSLPEKLFVSIGLFYGILFLLITPPFQTPDEPAHFFRALQLSEGQLLPQKQHDGVGGFLPEGIASTVMVFDSLPFHIDKKHKTENIFKTLDLPLNKKNKVFLHFPNTGLYTPVPYLPQILGIMLGKMFEFSPLKLMYIGRFFNLCIWALLLYLAIKLTPVHKWVFLLLGLTPMSLSQAASLSADGLTNGLSFLLIAVILRKALAKDAVIDKKDICILFILSLLLALSKQIYFIIPLLFLLIPKEKINFRKIVVALLLISNVATIILWTFSLKEIYRNVYIIYDRLVPGVSSISPGKQLQFILSNPVTYIGIIARTFLQDVEIYFDQYIGQLGWLNINLPEPLRIVYLIAIMITAATSMPKQQSVFCRQKIIILSTGLATVVMIATSLYMTSNPVGRMFIGGIQGRYFIPISPLFFLLLSNNRFRINMNKTGFVLAITCISVFTLTYSLWIIIHKYYI